MKHTKFIILGIQASGKGTQAAILSKKLGIPTVSMGDKLRAERKLDTPRGKLIRSLIDEGKFVPNEISNGIAKDYIESPEAKGGFILDGYPRTIEQARFLDSLVPHIRAIIINISDDEARKRLVNRRICSKCGTNFNLISLPPKKEGVCDLCGGALIQRDDDKPGVIEDRLKKFHKETEPISDYYRQHKEFVEINGEQSVEDVAAEIEKKVIMATDNN